MNLHIEAAMQAFEAGKLVAVPTETVYGICAPIHKPELIEKIYQIKNRPKTSALSIQVSSIHMARQYSLNWTDLTEKLATHYWPGPLTLVVPANDEVSKTITANTGYIGLRMPDQNLTLSLINKLGIPIAAPSANPHTLKPPVTAKQVRSYFDEQDVYVLDGGACKVSKESTILKITGNNFQILREKAISAEDLQKFLR